MSNSYTYETTIPVAPLSLGVMENCRDFGEKVDQHIAEIRRSRQELFESLSLYYRVFIKKEDVSELLDEEDGE